MRRYYRLAAPGAAFAAIGALLLVLAPLPSFTLIGGLATSGCYALAMQLVLSMFLLVAVDDLQRLVVADGHSSAEVTAVTGSNLGGALRDFYRRHPLPAALLGFGLAISVAAVLVGASGGVVRTAPAAIGLAVLLALSSVAQLPTVERGFFGWTVGCAAGSFLALKQFQRIASYGPLMMAWIALGACLCALGGIVYAVKRSKRKRRLDAGNEEGCGLR